MYTTYGLDWISRSFFPEGYDLVERKEHKLQRLEESIADKKRARKIYEGLLLQVSEAIEQEEKELLELKKD
jgi:hypothetical protein